MKEVNVLFNGALNTFYLRRQTTQVKDHSDSERGNPLPPHGLLFSISSNVFFNMHHPRDRITHTTAFVTPDTWRVIKPYPSDEQRLCFCHAVCRERDVVDRSLMVDPLSYFLHKWLNKGRGMFYPSYGTVIIKW